MIRRSLTAIVAAILFASGATAQTANWQFRWQQGQILTYRVEHLTSASDVTRENKNDTKTRLNLTKRWQVLDVDAGGIATVQLSLLALRLETTTPSGGTLLYDSSNPDKTDPQMKKELDRFVGQPLAVLRVDAHGRVVEVKESKHGPASRFDAELPFAVVLADEGPKVDQTWERAYKMTLEPPQGTGDAYDAIQKYTCTSVTGTTATIALSTAFKKLPESPLDRVPLLQMQPEGEVIFDIQAGRLQRAHFKIEKELTGHQGEGSSYRFQSEYTEEYAGDK